MRKDFRADSWFSGVLVYSGLAVVGEHSSDDVHVHWLLFHIVLHLIRVTVWSLPLLLLGCFKSPGRPEALAISDHLWGLPTGGSLQWQISCWSVALAAVDLLRGLQTVGYSEKQSRCCPVWSCSPEGPTDFGFSFPVCKREAFSMLGQVPCMPQNPQEVFRLWCTVALCAADLLGCLRLWSQLPWVQWIS